jgi:hypothetical protein
MTLLRKLTFLIIIIIAAFTFLLATKNYLPSMILITVTFYLGIKWYHMMIEELVVYRIMRNGKKIKYDILLDEFGKKAISAIKRLVRKDIAQQVNNDVVLKVSQFKFSMTKYTGETADASGAKRNGNDE